MRNHAFPSIRSRLMGPKKRESWERLRLSPMTKYSSGPSSLPVELLSGQFASLTHSSGRYGSWSLCPLM